MKHGNNEIVQRSRPKYVNSNDMAKLLRKKGRMQHLSQEDLNKLPVRERTNALASHGYATGNSTANNPPWRITPQPSGRFAHSAQPWLRNEGIWQGCTNNRPLPQHWPNKLPFIYPWPEYFSGKMVDGAKYWPNEEQEEQEEDDVCKVKIPSYLDQVNYELMKIVEGKSPALKDCLVGNLNALLTFWKMYASNILNEHSTNQEYFLIHR